MPFTEYAPGVSDSVAPETQGFALNHSMVRIKDPQTALDFYTRIFGMRLLRKLDFPEMQFSLYFLANLDDSAHVPQDTRDRTEWLFAQRGLLELTHNWGTEKDADVRYHNGNDQPQGYGHICFSVPNLDAAVAWFDAHGVEFIKRPEQGKMRDVAFVKDPDGYWIEIIQPDLCRSLGL